VFTPSSPPNSEEPINVLIVDDRVENRVALAAMLSSPAYHLVEAGSAEAALRHLLEGDFAVLLVDVVMPGMNGFELAAAVKERERTAAVPIVFLTAHALDAELVYKGYRAGGVDYLTKPLVPEMVRAKVAVFAELHRQKKRLQHQAELLLDAERRDGELRLLELKLAGERHFRSLADAVPHIIWTAGPEGRVDYFNQRWFEYTGMSAQQASGSWAAALHPDDVTSSRDAWAKALRSGRMFEGELRLHRSSDDSYRWHLCRAVPERGSTGQIISWLGTFTDIEDQKRAQAALTEFKGTLDAVLDAVVIFEPERWRLIYANEGARILLGFSHEELYQLRLVDVMAEHDEHDFRELLAPLNASATHRATLETRCRRKDGKEIPVEFSFQLVRIGGGHIVAIARDITDRKLAELEREHLYGEAIDAIRARDDFLSIASHELKTPLSSLKLLLEMLVRSTVPPEIERKLEMGLRQVEKLSELISELMDLSRIRAGRLRLDLEPADLAIIAADVVTRFREDALKAGCEVTLHAEAPVRGTWDPLRMEQVVTNLLANALKFGAGKPIEIQVCASGARAQLVVRDHGIGIGDDDIERVFRRFERATAARSYAGMGLGLYIVRQIVEAHGGTIRVESQPGAGSTFTVDVPLEAHAAEPDVAGEAESAAF
jgi:PAS domain S-box-containing protein